MKIKSLWTGFLKRRHKYDELRDYLKPSWRPVVVYLKQVIILGFIAYAVTVFTEGSGGGILWVVWFFLVVLLYKCIGIMVSFYKMIKNLRSDGNGEIVLRDFNGARSFFDDTLRIGSRFIYGKESGYIIPFVSIRRVFQKNTSEQSRELVIITTNRKECDIATLKKDDDSERELQSVLTILLEENPRIAVVDKKRH